MWSHHWHYFFDIGVRGHNQERLGRIIFYTQCHHAHVLSENKPLFLLRKKVFGTRVVKTMPHDIMHGTYIPCDRNLQFTAVFRSHRTGNISCCTLAAQNPIILIEYQRCVLGIKFRDGTSALCKLVHTIMCTSAVFFPNCQKKTIPDMEQVPMCFLFQ